jgi:hypothetical protein
MIDQAVCLKVNVRIFYISLLCAHFCVYTRVFIIVFRQGIKLCQIAVYGRNGRSGSFRWTKFKQTAWKLTAVTFLVAILIWRNEHLLMQPMPRT